MKDAPEGIRLMKKYIDIDSPVASKKIKVHNQLSNLVVLSTLWKGEFMLCYFDIINKTISSIYCFQELSEEDFEKLEIVVNDFIFSTRNNFGFAIDK